MRDYLPEIIAILLLIAAVIFGVNKAAMNDEKFWNDGHCDICGGAWKYEQAVGHNAHTSYIYVC